MILWLACHTSAVALAVGSGNSNHRDSDEHALVINAERLLSSEPAGSVTARIIIIEHTHSTKCTALYEFAY